MAVKSAQTQTRKSDSSFQRIVFLFLAIAFLASGCQKKSSRKSELRFSTRDLVAAAQKAGGRDAEIVIRPEMGARQGERARGGRALPDSGYAFTFPRAHRTGVSPARVLPLAA